MNNAMGQIPAGIDTDTVIPLKDRSEPGERTGSRDLSSRFRCSLAI